jgi:hypothetical protein
MFGRSKMFSDELFPSLSFSARRRSMDCFCWDLGEFLTYRFPVVVFPNLGVWSREQQGMSILTP